MAVLIYFFLMVCNGVSYIYVIIYFFNLIFVLNIFLRFNIFKKCYYWIGRYFMFGFEISDSMC